MSNRMIVAKDGWGDIPDWIAALVDACDKPGASQNKVARELNVSPTVVSQAISNKYGGDLARVEDRVRSVFMNPNVVCPALGEIGAKTCLQWRDRATSFKSTRPDRVHMFKACRDCPRNQKTDEGIVDHD